MNKFIINKSILINNIRIIRSQINNSKLCAMVKADAYGHGLVRIAKIIEPYVNYFGVACISEGIKLRNNNIHIPILVVGGYDKRLARLGVINDLTITVDNLQSVKHLAVISCKLRIKTRVHIKVNTGMNRYGLNTKKELKDIIKFIKQSQYLELEGIFSHISYATNSVSTKQQISKFKKFCSILPKKVMRHIASSTVVRKYPSACMDMVRVGIALYGYELQCNPILQVESNIVDIRQVYKGETVGYNNAYTVLCDSFVATVCMGYADGINRKLLQGGKVAIDGSYYPISEMYVWTALWLI